MLTLIIEPDPNGHRFQAVAHVAARAARSDQVVLLTSIGASATDAFATHLSDADLKVDEIFDAVYPPTRELAAVIAEYCRREQVGDVVVMDADQSLKRWWLDAPREFRGLARLPRVVFMLTRYPARLSVTDRFGWMLRVTKSSLVAAAMTTGTLQRAAGFAGRDERSRGWLIKRARDPAICSRRSAERGIIRADLGLPPQRALIGVFGVISERKNPQLVLLALLAGNCDADLVLAGSVQPEVAAWLDGLPAEIGRRVHVRDEFLPDDVLDSYVACVDAVAIAMTNNGPSGIMGKALAAGVPVVSAGSRVRARELTTTGAGVCADLSVPGLAIGIRRVLDGERDVRGPHRAVSATAAEFAAVVLGDDGMARWP